MSTIKLIDKLFRKEFSGNSKKHAYKQLMKEIYEKYFELQDCIGHVNISIKFDKNKQQATFIVEENAVLSKELSEELQTYCNICNENRNTFLRGHDRTCEICSIRSIIERCNSRLKIKKTQYRLDIRKTQYSPIEEEL